MIYQLRVLVICLAFIALGLLLAGCRDDTTTAQKIALGCSSAAAAIRVLTVADNADLLSDDSRSAVVQAITITDPVCRRPTPPSLTDVELAAFIGAARALQDAAATAPQPRPTGYRL